MEKFQLASTEEIGVKLGTAPGVLDIRDVDAGVTPFAYSSGNQGPGYLMVKGTVAQPKLFMFLIKQLAYRVLNEEAQFDFINGNVTGGMIPGWQLSRELSDLLDKQVPFTYLREARKEGGHGELITGNKEFINPNDYAFIIEELVNFAETTAGAVKIFRNAGYNVSHTGCILAYDHQKMRDNLKAVNVQLICDITLPELLDVNEENKIYEPHLVQSYRDFLADSIEWQLQRDYPIPTAYKKDAEKKGYTMIDIKGDEAVKLKAPASKATPEDPKKTIFYCVKEELLK